MSEDELGFRRHLPPLRSAIGDIPILAVGKILPVEDAERIVARGEADAVVMARGLLANPESADYLEFGVSLLGLFEASPS